MSNVYGTATRLTEGMEVGYAQPLESIKSVTPDVQCASIEAILKTPERSAELQRILGVGTTSLSKGHVFALSDHELGCTDIVCHSVDTGNAPPIKQQPYRTPIVHRETISKMIEKRMVARDFVLTIGV